MRGRLRYACAAKQRFNNFYGRLAAAQRAAIDRRSVVGTGPVGREAPGRLLAAAAAAAFKSLAAFKAVTVIMMPVCLSRFIRASLAIRSHRDRGNLNPSRH